MTPELSVIVPTLRPAQAIDCITSILAAVGLVEAEIIVVCDQATEDAVYPTVPKDVRLPVIFTVRETHDGPIAAIDQGASIAAGDYLFVLSDEDRLEPNALQVQYAIAEAARKNGETAIFCPWQCGTGWAYFGRVFPPFPFVHRSIIAGPLQGVFFDTAYGAHYADPDLGQRAAEANIPIRLCPDAKILHYNENDPVHQANHSKYFDQDERTFRARWGHLGPWPSLSM